MHLLIQYTLTPFSQDMEENKKICWYKKEASFLKLLTREGEDKVSSSRAIHSWWKSGPKCPLKGAALDQEFYALSLPLHKNVLTLLCIENYNLVSCIFFQIWFINFI